MIWIPTLWRSGILNLKPSRSRSFFLWAQINDVQHKLNSTLVPSYCPCFSELVLDCIALHPTETMVSSYLMWFHYRLTKYFTDITVFISCIIFLIYENQKIVLRVKLYRYTVVDSEWNHWLLLICMYVTLFLCMAQPRNGHHRKVHNTLIILTSPTRSFLAVLMVYSINTGWK